MEHIIGVGDASYTRTLIGLAAIGSLLYGSPLLDRRLVHRIASTMRTPRAAIACATLTLLTVLPGCATVVNGRTADVKLKTSPPNALVTIQDQDGTVVAQTTTPGQVELKRKGSGLKPARYTATFERPGYQPVRTELKSTLNPWLIGNVILGGPIGLGVDMATGAMWRPKYHDVELPLAQLGQPSGEVQMASATDTPPNVQR